MWIAAAALPIACVDERPRPDPTPPALVATAGAASRPAAAPVPSATVRVAGVRGDPNIDTDAVRVALRNAETALSACLDGDGTVGLLVLRFPVEGDGLVGEITVAPESTFGSDDASACIEHLIESMRLPASASSGRGEVEVRLDIARDGDL